jgi:2TM domain-containing protein
MTETEMEEVAATSEKGLRDPALERVKKRRDFHTHLFAYVSINLVLWGVWAVIGATAHGWYPWPLGWAIGLVFNAWDVYFRHPITEADVRREMDRLGGGAAR